MFVKSEKWKRLLKHAFVPTYDVIFFSSKHEKSNNSKTHCDKTKKQQFVIKLKNLNCDKTQKANCDITQIQIVTTQNCDNIQMQMVTKL